MKTLSMAEIFAETKAAYEDPDNFALNVDGMASCQYLTEDGKKCAIGRCLIDPGRLMFAGSLTGINGEYQISNKQWSDEWLKPQYRGHPPRFWINLQKWHDTKALLHRAIIKRDGGLQAIYRTKLSNVEISLNHFIS
jgi:hypothetical protein